MCISNSEDDGGRVFLFRRCVYRFAARGILSLSPRLLKRTGAEGLGKAMGVVVLGLLEVEVWMVSSARRASLCRARTVCGIDHLRASLEF